MLALYWRMLRYRVAAMILLFMLLGSAWHGGLRTLDAPVLLVALALASSYVCATSVNDISDREIDRINHPDDVGRPLVTGTAGTGDLWTLFGVSGVLAVALSFAAGPRRPASWSCPSRSGSSIPCRRPGCRTGRSWRR